MVPKGSVVPIRVNRGFSSQYSVRGEDFSAIADVNYITNDKYILIYKGTKFSGTLIEAEKGKWFVKNGVLRLGTNTMTTLGDQNVIIKSVGNVTKKKGRFMSWVRKVFKGEKLKFKQGDTLYFEFQSDIKSDLTNGWIY